MARILIVDDEAGLLSVISTMLKAEGYDVVPMREGDKALELLRREDFDLMIADIRMRPIDGMQILRTARAERPDVAVIMLTAYGSIETAIEAMKLGAFDYITKPFKVDELLVIIRRALEYSGAMKENLSLKAQAITRYRFENIVADSRAMKSVCEMIERVAPTETTVLIYGESGTGKELVAKAIHAYSQRRTKRFLAVNCAALPEPLLESEMFGHVKGAFTGASTDKVGLFEAAEGGTIFLDEIGSMPLSIQGKLLRVLQEKEIRKVGGTATIKVDARVLAATNNRLEDLIKSGQFREDLYYRLSIIPLSVEPLRNRREDIMPIVSHVIRQELGPNAELPAIDEDVRRILERYTWPGNVRELISAVKHALTFASNNRITKEVLPAKILSSVGDLAMDPTTEDAANPQFRSLDDFLRAKEADYLQQVVDAFGGDKEKAAQALKVSLATLYRKLPRNLVRPRRTSTASETETPAPVLPEQEGTGEGSDPRME
jgi:DNA-binding NtrC family response regulator